MSQALVFDLTFSEHSHVHYLTTSLLQVWEEGMAYVSICTGNEKARAQEGQRACSRSHGYFQTRWGPEPRGAASRDSPQGSVESRREPPSEQTARPTLGKRTGLAVARPAQSALGPC